MKFILYHILLFLLYCHQISGHSNVRWKRSILGPPTDEFFRDNTSSKGDEIKSNRSLTVIRSRSLPPKWMVSVGGSQEELELLYYSSQQFRPKSIQMDFALNSEIPVPTILYDQLENLDPMVSVNKIDYEKLKQKVRDRYQKFGHILVEACASETPDNELQMTTIWSENQALTSTVLMVSDANAIEERNEVEQKLMDGFLPVSVCGFQRKGASVSYYLIVFVRPQNMPEVPRSLALVKIGQSLSDFMQQDRILSRQGFNAQRLHVHMNAKGELKCAAIYWPIPSYAADHFINQGPDLQMLYAQTFQRKRGSEFAPKSVSRILLNNQEQFVVLWGRGTLIWALPPPMPLREPGYAIPFQYMPGINMELPTQLLSLFNHHIIEFMRRFDLPGLTVAVVKNEKLKLGAAFGYANLKSAEQLTPTHKFRIGSISKVLTATALALLIDEGLLNLDEKVFGEDSIFDFEYATNGTYQPFVEKINIRHLMSHTVGSWSNMDDPVFKADLSTTPEQLIKDTIQKQLLTEVPGTHFQYSNFGYMILGKVIEKKTGLPYVEFVNQKLFEPIGLPRQELLSLDMSAENSVLYYPTVEMSDDPYELPNPLILAACCGWSMTPVEFLKFLTHADGFPDKLDLISHEAFTTLGIPTKESNYTYGLGWTLNDKGFNGRLHQGQMPSALSLVARTDNGIEILIATNKFPPRMIALSEMSYLAHHLISLFEGPELDDYDHFN